MPKIKTAELAGLALRWAVAKAEKHDPWWDSGLETWFLSDHPDLTHLSEFSPDTNWSQGGPIFEREIDNFERRVGYFYVHRFRRHAGRVTADFKTVPGDREAFAYGPTLLIAGMRCYVAGVLGAEVDVPEELLR